MHHCGSLQITCLPQTFVIMALVAGDVDEEGLDQGGVKKEFFQLLTREIFNEVSFPLLMHASPLTGPLCAFRRPAKCCVCHSLCVRCWPGTGFQAG